jgi:hypothetical protein
LSTRLQARLLGHCFGGALRFALQLSRSLLRFALDFHAIGALLNLLQKFAGKLFKFGKDDSRLFFKLSLPFTLAPLKIEIEGREFVSDRRAFFFESAPQSFGFFSFALNTPQVFSRGSRRLSDVFICAGNNVRGNSEPLRDVQA